MLRETLGYDLKYTNPTKYNCASVHLAPLQLLIHVELMLPLLGPSFAVSSIFWSNSLILSSLNV